MSLGKAGTKNISWEIKKNGLRDSVVLQFQGSLALTQRVWILFWKLSVKDFTDEDA